MLNLASFFRLCFSAFNHRYHGGFYPPLDRFNLPFSAFNSLLPSSPPPNSIPSLPFPSYPLLQKFSLLPFLIFYPPLYRFYPPFSSFTLPSPPLLPFTALNLPSPPLSPRSPTPNCFSSLPSILPHLYSPSFESFVPFPPLLSPPLFFFLQQPFSLSSLFLSYFYSSSFVHLLFLHLLSPLHLLNFS